MHDPDDIERREFFEDLLLKRTSDPPLVKHTASCQYFLTLLVVLSLVYLLEI